MIITLLIKQGDLDELHLGWYMPDPMGRIIIDDNYIMPKFVLDYYIWFHRDSKRHKFQAVREKVWNRINQRNNTLKLEDIVIPTEAITRAKEALSTIAFVKPLDKL